MKKTKSSSFLSSPVPNFVAYAVLALLCLTVITVAILLPRSTGTISWQPNKIDIQTASASRETVGGLTAFVDEAAAQIVSQGEKVFPEFRQKNSHWWQGNRYIFVYDLNGKTLVLPPTPEVEGTNRLNAKDADGIRYVGEMIGTLRTKNSGWLQYRYPEPGKTSAVNKLSYFKKVNYQGKTYLVGSGIFLR